MKVISTFIFIILASSLIFGQKTDIESIKKALIPIDSITESNFDFLKQKLSNKSIVFLGESNHHTETYNQIKFEIIKLLNKELGFTVVAFESDLSASLHSNIVKDSLSSLDLLTHTILGCWRTESNYKLMSYIKSNELNIAGFDPNHNSLFLEKNYYSPLFPTNQKLAQKLFSLDSTFQDYEMVRGRYLRSANEDSSLLKKLNKTQSYLMSSYENILKDISLSPYKQILKISIENKLEILKSSNQINLSFDKRFLTNEKREELMARNLEFLIDSIYPNEKVIIWAHNEHISKGGESTDIKKKNTFVNNSLGYRLYKKYAEKSYYIGLYGYPGEIGIGYSNKTENLIKPKKKSIEHLLFNCNIQSCFVPTNLDCFKKPLYNFSEGNFTQRKIIHDCYDAVVFSRDLKPAVLIKFSEREKYK